MSQDTTYSVLDKSTNEVLAEVPNSTADDALNAIVRATAASKVWGAAPTHERVAALRTASARIEAESERLATLLARETGKTIGDARIEIATTARVFFGFSEEASRHFGQAMELDRQVGNEKDILITRHEPLGVVVAITPFNFPAELYAHKVAAALGTGNAIIVKPAEHNPLIALALTEILHESGVPADALQVVTGRGRTVGVALTESPDVNAITFTGSTFVGQQIATAAAKNLIRATLELGGNDAFIVDAQADIDLAVAEAIGGRTFSNGQVCVATKRIILVSAIEAEFTEKLVAEVQKLTVGGALEDGTKIGPLISLKAAETVEQQVTDALAEGGELLHGGQREGAFYHPAVVRVSVDSAIAKDEEIFGPVFSLIVVDNLEEAVNVANASSYGLNAAVFTTDIVKAYTAAERLQAGIVSINGGNLYRPDGSAFGGYKKSGIGREGFFYSLEEFTQLKTIALRGFRGATL